MALSKIGTAGIADDTAVNGFTPTASNMAGRNRIINGDMRIDQRNAGAAVTATDGGYQIDRCQTFTESADGVFTVQRVADAPAGFINSAKITVTTADASIGASQRYLFVQNIEGFNAADLGFGATGASTVTLSFWAKSSITGTFGGSLLNSSFNRAYPFNYSISTANTWEYKTVTIAGDTSGTWAKDSSVGFRLMFGIGVGSGLAGPVNTWSASSYYQPTGSVNLISTLNATLNITGVQLEAGSVATPFEHVDYSEMLRRCQRYFISYGGTGVYERIGTSLNNATNNSITMFTFPVEMRSIPTFGYTAVGNFGLYDGQNVITVTGFSIDSPSTKVCTVGVGVASGLTTKSMVQFLTNNTTSARATWSAEL